MSHGPFQSRMPHSCEWSAVVWGVCAIWLCGCIEQIDAQPDAYPNKWSVVLDEERFLAFRDPPIPRVDNGPHEAWAFLKDAHWLPMGEFETYAVEHFREPGTFVYIFRVGPNKKELDSAAQILGRLGVFGIGQKESLKEEIERGDQARSFLELLPKDKAQ